MSGRDIDLYNLQELWEGQKTALAREGPDLETQKRVVAFLVDEIIALRGKVKILEKENEKMKKERNAEKEWFAYAERDYQRRVCDNERLDQGGCVSDE